MDLAMADAMTPPALTYRMMVFYGILLLAAIAGGYYYLQQPKTSPVLTAGYAIKSQATRFYCTPSLSRVVGESGQGGIQRWLGDNQTDLYLIVAQDKQVKVGETLKIAEGRGAAVWAVEKNTGDQLVIYTQDPANPVMDRAATLVLDKTNGVGLFKNTLNRQFQYLACKELEDN
jgi:hypothetical protein